MWLRSPVTQSAPSLSPGGSGETCSMARIKGGSGNSFILEREEHEQSKCRVIGIRIWCELPSPGHDIGDSDPTFHRVCWIPGT